MIILFRLFAEQHKLLSCEMVIIFTLVWELCSTIKNSIPELFIICYVLIYNNIFNKYG
jgi:hypothetical protein